MRALSAEGVLSLKPTLVIATTAAGPATTLDQLRATGIEVLVLPDHYDYDSVIAKIAAVGTADGQDGGSRRDDRARPRRHGGARDEACDGDQQAARAVPAVDGRRRAAGGRPRHGGRRHHPARRRHECDRRLRRLSAADARGGPRVPRRLRAGDAPDRAGDGRHRGDPRSAGAAPHAGGPGRQGAAVRHAAAAGLRPAHAAGGADLAAALHPELARAP